jgi:hypothetical protein
MVDMEYDLQVLFHIDDIFSTFLSQPMVMLYYETPPPSLLALHNP